MTSTIWSSALTRTRAALDEAPSAPMAARADTLAAMSAALADTETVLSGALTGDTVDGDAGVECASRLLTATAHLSAAGRTPADARRHTGEALEGELRFLEEAVLEGERTYELDGTGAPGAGKGSRSVTPSRPISPASTTIGTRSAARS